jgi:hypothetical protein
MSKQRLSKLQKRQVFSNEHILFYHRATLLQPISVPRQTPFQEKRKMRFPVGKYFKIRWKKSKFSQQYISEGKKYFLRDF